MEPVLSVLLITCLLLLSPLNCKEEIDGDGESFASVNGAVSNDLITKSGKEMKIAGKTGRVGRAFCSLSTEPNHLVMFQYLYSNSTPAELSDCCEVRIRSHEQDTRGNKKIHILDSVPIIIDGPQIQFSFYDLHGNITPTKLNGDYDFSLTINNWIPDAFSIFCTLSNYEARLTAKSGKFSKETRATVHCDISDISRQVIPETVPSSVYMTQNISEVIQEVAKLVSFYQWGYSSFTYKIRGLDIVTLSLTSRTRQNVTFEEFQITASLSFSTSLLPFRVLSVAVLVKSTLRQFENINYDENDNEPQLEGFSVDVFKAAAEVLPYHFSYKLVPFYGSGDQLVEEVVHKVLLLKTFVDDSHTPWEPRINFITFDAAVGDILITAKTAHLVEYSQPYGELRLMMVLKKKYNELNSVLWFMSPFTRETWLSLVAMTVFTGFVIWFIEHRSWNDESADDSPACSQVEAVFCFPFALIFNEYRPSKKLSYFLLIPWLMLNLIATTTFTASLGSMVTSSQVVPSDSDIDSLKRTNAAIACDGNPFTFSYLEQKLGFKPKNIRNITSIDDCSEALSSGKIKAAFLLTPDAEAFLAKYCREGFSKSGPAFNLGSFAFVFPRGSSLASGISEAILQLKEEGKLKQMEKHMLSSSDCSCSNSDGSVSKGIGPGAFSGLFILSGCASASALLITVIRLLKKRWGRYIRGLLMGRSLNWIWLAILFSHHNQTTNELQLSRVSSNTQI